MSSTVLVIAAAWPHMETLQAADAPLPLKRQMTLVACVSVLLAALASLFMSSSRAVYLLDFSCYKPPDRCAIYSAFLSAFHQQVTTNCIRMDNGDQHLLNPTNTCNCTQFNSWKWSKDYSLQMAKSLEVTAPDGSKSKVRACGVCASSLRWHRSRQSQQRGQRRFAGCDCTCHNVLSNENELLKPLPSPDVQ